MRSPTEEVPSLEEASQPSLSAELLYLSVRRKDDTPPDKPPDERDATDTGHGGHSPGVTSAKRQLTRKELKQLDREVP